MRSSGAILQEDEQEEHHSGLKVPEREERHTEPEVPEQEEHKEEHHSEVEEVPERSQGQ